jgi:hypothetical protein
LFTSIDDICKDIDEKEKHDFDELFEENKITNMIAKCIKSENPLRVSHFSPKEVIYNKYHMVSNKLKS